MTFCCVFFPNNHTLRLRTRTRHDQELHEVVVTFLLTRVDDSLDDKRCRTCVLRLDEGGDREGDFVLLELGLSDEGPDLGDASLLCVLACTLEVGEVAEKHLDGLAVHVVLLVDGMRLLEEACGGGKACDLLVVKVLETLHVVHHLLRGHLDGGQDQQVLQVSVRKGVKAR